MLKTVDARGEGCPKPVIMTKKALDESDAKEINVLVDNDIAKENVLKLINKMGLKHIVVQKGTDYTITITNDEESVVNIPMQKSDTENVVISISNDLMGNGDEELGRVLINGFIYSLTEVEPYPRSIIFFNNGVKLTCEGSKALQNLIHLEQAGVEIISCGTCLDYFELKDKLKVGQISNMYTITETLKNADRVINI